MKSHSRARSCSRMHSARHGATVYIDDPLFSNDELRALGYTPLTPEVEGEICAIILQADHQAYQWFDFSRFAGLPGRA